MGSAIVGVLFFTLLASGQVATDYRPETETTLTGTVRRVEKHSIGGHPEIHLLVDVESGEVEIHVGPRYFLQWHQFQFRKGDRLVIVAARAAHEPHYLARTVQSGSRTLVLRDEQGLPLWDKRKGP